MEYIPGGICAAKGFRAAGVFCGVKKKKKALPGTAEKKDLALIVSDVPCSAAGVFTRNQVKAAPVLLDLERIATGRAQAVTVNSGNANACAPFGMENALRMGKAAADVLGLPEELVLVGSTGVIGQTLNIEAIETGMPQAAAQLSSDGSADAAQAIMTTDTTKKEVAVAFSVDGVTVHLGGIAKGSGMIHPNMGTMLCYLTTDCAISPEMLQQALRRAADVSFNRISVDGDTSTNDSCLLLANGLAGNPVIDGPGAAYDTFLAALSDLCICLARAMAMDGEGAEHLITCQVSGAADEAKAVRLGKSVIASTLTKCAVFGGDANWGRILCAMGYSGETFDPDAVDIAFSSAAGHVPVCRGGRGLDFDEALAASVLKEKEVIIEINLFEGDGKATSWGCDMTYEYVKINGDYRT